MSIILDILLGLLKIILPALFERAANPPRPTAEDAKANTLRDTLRARVRETWGRTALPLILVFLCLGCAGTTRTIYVRDGEPVRVRRTIPGAEVWILDADGKPTPGVMDIPEGWYALPVPGDNATK